MFFGVGRRVLRSSLLLIFLHLDAAWRDRYPRLWLFRWLDRLDHGLFDGARSEDLLELVVWSVIGADCIDWINDDVEVAVGSPFSIAGFQRHCLRLVGLPSVTLTLDLRPAQVGLILTRLSTLNQNQCESGFKKKTEKGSNDNNFNNLCTY